MSLHGKIDGTLSNRGSSLGASAEGAEDLCRSARTTRDDRQPVVAALDDEAGEELGPYEVRVSYWFGVHDISPSRSRSAIETTDSHRPKEQTCEGDELHAC